MIVYPEDYDYDSNNKTIALISGNLLPTIIIYDNGTIITVGSLHKYMDVQSENVNRVIWNLRTSQSNVDRFISSVNSTRFKSERTYYWNRSNKICDIYYDYSSYYVEKYEICLVKGESSTLIDSIRAAIIELVNSHHSESEYIPSKYYVNTVIFDSSDNLPGSVIIYNYTTYLWNLLGHEDHRLLCMIWETLKTDCYYYTSSLHPVLNAVNKHITYSNYVKYYQFMIWIPELSLTSYPTPYTSTYYTTYTSWYTSYTYTYTYLTDYSNYFEEPTYRDNSLGIFIIVISVIGVGFLAACIAFILRRYYINKKKSESTELRNFSDEDISSHEEPKVQPTQTNYPIFVQSNAPTTYPIFVQSGNPMMTPVNNQMTNPMMNPMVSNSGVVNMFPQPTVFYPTNQN